MDLKAIRLNIPQGCNIILGQTHFIKTVEDLYEILVGSIPGVQFGVAFNEASGPCLVRKEGNDPDLVKAAVDNIREVGAGQLSSSFLRMPFRSMCSTPSRCVMKCAPSIARRLTL